MRYESEILYDLMKRDGLLNPSQDNLPYESELKEKYVNEVEGAYPKLIDYQAEWLNYAYNNPIGEFPYVTLSDVTNATIENVVPYAYRSAILKGNTIKNYKNNLFDNVLEKGMISISTGEPNGSNLGSYRSVNFIPINGNFKIAKYGIYGDLHVCFYDSNKSFISGQAYVLRKVVEGNAIVTPPTNSSFIKFYNPYDDNEPTGEFGFGVMAENEMIELEIQSVKMAVLTTTGKNLFDSELEVGGLNSINGGNDDEQKDRIRTKSYIKVKPNTFYILSRTKYNGIWSVRYYDENYNHISPNSYNAYAKIEFKTGVNVHYIRMVDLTNDLSNLYQLEEGKQVTSYEPYKSNILTVNEDVELGSVGEVKDELNLLTGQLTQRTETRAYQEGDESNSEVITDMTNTRYKLPKEVIKTVDLTILDQNGSSLNQIKPIEGTMYLSTSGKTIKPLFSGEIPVEAITQNLASFIEE